MASQKGEPVVREFADIDGLRKSRNQLEYALHQAVIENQPQGIINGIRKKLADYFYSRNEYDDASRTYIDTIGYLEPSYVINQFIDAKLAEYLLQYLTALSSHGFKEEMYTSLRFNCLIRLKKVSEIQQLVDKALNNEPVDFDVKTAVKSLNREGYTFFALQLAEHFQFHQEQLAILAQNAQYSKMADVLINATVASPKISELILNYGPIILRTVTDVESRKKITNFIAEYSVKVKRGKAREFLGIFAEYPDLQLAFLKKLMESSPDKMTSELWDILIPLYAKATPDRLYDEVIKNKNASYSTDFAAFSLKNIIQQYPDLRNALKPSLHAILEKRELYRDILNDCESNEIPKLCIQYLPKDPTIWREGLSILAKASAKEPLQQLVDFLIQNNVVPINSIIIVLEKSRFPLFGLIKKYSVNIATDLQKSVDSLQEELDSLDQKIEAGVEFQRQMVEDYFIVRPNQCGECNIHIDPPSKHFPCGHSYHVSCLKGPATGCPKCQKEHQDNANKKLELYSFEKNHENILSEIEASDHYYTLFQDFIGNGIMMPKADASDIEDIQELLKRINGEVSN